MLSPDERAFRKDVASKLEAYISKKFKSKTAAARALGISKQRLHKYLTAAMTPKSDFLCMVARKWKLRFRYRRVLFGAGAFRSSPLAVTSSSIGDQLGLFDIPQVLRSRKLEVTIHRKNPRSMNLSIEIKLVS
jgi:hypothetical protein